MYSDQENYNGTMERNLNVKVGNALSKIAEKLNLSVDYFTIAACALEILDEYIGEGYDFPVDIERVAVRAGIEVICQPLNGSVSREDIRPHKMVGKTIKRKNIVTQEPINCILIDSESSKAEQRYALAHELAHYLIWQDETSYSNEYCLMPMLFKQQQEMIADIFANFLLIPLPAFLREFSEYIGNQPVPIQTSEWLAYLSYVAQVPYEYVAIGYENIRYVCCVVHYYLSHKVDVKKYPKDEAIRQIVIKQMDKMKLAMTDEVRERLFY